MTALYDYNEELSEVFESFYRSVKHPYLMKYIEDPVIDKDQATILFYLLKEKELSEKYKHDCILTVLLVQAALDTHETVNIHELGSEQLKTKRQLTVLAGDYYSSLYYYVLSKLEDVSLIRVLSRSIQEINESKMNIYKHHKKRIQPNVSDLKTIYASIVTNIAHLFNVSEWSEVIEEFLFLKALLHERFLFQEYAQQGKALNFFHNAQSGKTSSLSDSVYLETFNQYIEDSLQNLHVLKINKQSMDTYIKLRIESLMLEYQLKEQCAVEEG
ncbi:heptaprenyl diphosphate synthase component 1 [Salipaludibacillus keqinensis]|nr:heptaprenyl diphosphate synthase component 1 [Salipaludibacillus keqinensis]